MKPGDHPEFFRFPAPEGRSRESAIRLDANGVFHDHEEIVAHAGLARAMHGWIRRHPDDGRFILSNGYDWTYFTVDDAPYTAMRVSHVSEQDHLTLALSDGSEEAWDPSTTRVGDGGALYAKVKGGTFEAKFTRHAQSALEPYLVEENGRAAIRVGGKSWPIGAR
jgi:hypothetical protein